jgi:hypothetical protein
MLFPGIAGSHGPRSESIPRTQTRLLEVLNMEATEYQKNESEKQILFLKEATPMVQKVL